MKNFLKWGDAPLTQNELTIFRVTLRRRFVLWIFPIHHCENLFTSFDLKTKLKSLFCNFTLFWVQKKNEKDRFHLLWFIFHLFYLNFDQRVIFFNEYDLGALGIALCVVLYSSKMTLKIHIFFSAFFLLVLAQ